LRRSGRVLGPAVAALLLLGAGAIARAEVVQKGDVRVHFRGHLTPKALPRHSPVPVDVAVWARISSVDGAIPPQLQKLALSINRYGRLAAGGLPICPLRKIQPATTAVALAACRASLVGKGTFSAKVLLTEQAPFPSQGKIYAFNGRYRGKPAILAHVYGVKPAPTSFTLPFVISRSGGTFGTTLTASLPQFADGVGYVTGLSLTLGKSYLVRGERHYYLSASCPAPRGFGGASFSLAKATFELAGGRTVNSTLRRRCTASDS
jgi:hypothetical protein